MTHCVTGARSHAPPSGPKGRARGKPPPPPDNREIGGGRVGNWDACARSSLSPEASAFRITGAPPPSHLSGPPYAIIMLSDRTIGRFVRVAAGKASPRPRVPIRTHLRSAPGSHAPPSPFAQPEKGKHRVNIKHLSSRSKSHQRSSNRAFSSHEKTSKGGFGILLPRDKTRSTFRPSFA